MHTAGGVVQIPSGLHQVGVFPKIRAHFFVFGFRSRLKTNWKLDFRFIFLIS